MRLMDVISILFCYIFTSQYFNNNIYLSHLIQKFFID